jgi:hypothetical protein
MPEMQNGAAPTVNVFVLPLEPNAIELPHWWHAVAMRWIHLSLWHEFVDDSPSLIKTSPVSSS